MRPISDQCTRYFIRMRCLITLFHLPQVISHHICDMSFRQERSMLRNRMQKYSHLQELTRGNITFLTDLFVLPTQQSGQLGKQLLHAILPQDDLVHCTVSSSDPRALALYIRASMRPQWPYFALQLEKPAHEKPFTSDMEIIEADPADPALVRWD